MHVPIAVLAAVTFLGVLGGHALCQFVPQVFLCRASAAAFVAVGVLTWFQVFWVHRRNNTVNRVRYQVAWALIA
jgi:putative Ca2+/H+ antiporter (TMEM165/GDT1 family)